MRRILLFFSAMLMMGLTVNAQNAHCLGLKNPTSFTMTGGSAVTQWTGYIGTKLEQASTCSSIGSSLTTTVTAANLLTTTSSSSPESSNSYDINGVNDATRRFSIKGSGYDAVTNNNLSYLPPDPTFTSSIRLGNSCPYTEAECLTYEFNVNSYNSLVTIWFSMALYNALHDAAHNPEFVITVEKQVGSSWQLAMGDTLCYIRPSPTSSSNLSPFSLSGTCVYLPWNKVIVNLNNLLFERVRIKIATGDCAYTAHYGYSYFAGECQPMRLIANGCAAGETDNVAGIKAPSGAISYEWYRSTQGVLSGSARTNDANYVLIAGETTDSLSVVLDHFRSADGTLNNQNTFMCKMVTKMNETKPITSRIYCEVGNTKPSFAVDSFLHCDASITLKDISITPFMARDSDHVDTTKTLWKFYSTTQPTDLSYLGSRQGGTVNFGFENAGNYCARVRTSAVDTSCWNEKTVQFRVVKAPVPRMHLERNYLCKGDAIALYDDTPQSTFRQWIIHHPTRGDSVITPNIPVIQFAFDTTTRITLRTRNNVSYMADTNDDGLVEQVYCYSTFDTTVFVGEYPKLKVQGDTIVCDGDRSDIEVLSDIDGCRFDWYQVLYGTTPYQENSSHLTTTITQDRRFYVKVTSPYGCESWDSVNLYLVKPALGFDKDKICTGDTVTLWAGKAATYEWSSNPDDPSFAGQAGRDTIRVSPEVSTTYTVVGLGTNGCRATALSQKVTVYPYPIMAVELTPEYIDSENPSVQFSDVSENGTSSLWEFGNGQTSQTRTVVHTFSDLSQDSILIHLTTGNALGCTRDTSFYVPVGIFAVWFPNAFTPKLQNGNRIFKPFTANDIKDYELYIYDRAGVLVFKTDNLENGWDGTCLGKDCPIGTYVYISKYRRAGVPRLITQKGTVTLIR